MNRRILVVLSLVIITILSLSSCELIVKDPEVDKQTVIVDVAGKTITKEQVNNAISQIKMIYQMRYGNSIDVNSDKFKNNVQQSAIDTLIAESVIDSKIKELGFNNLSESDLALIKESAKNEYAKNLENIKNKYFKETKLKDDELKNALIAKANELGYNTEDQLIERKSKEKMLANLRDSIIKDVAVSDDEVKAEYDKKVTQSKVNLDNNPSLYSSNAMNGIKNYYVPEGYRYVKQVLIKFNDDDFKMLNTLRKEMSEKEQQINTVKKSIEEEQKAIDSITDESKKDASRLNTLKESLAKYENEINALNTKIDETSNKAYEHINDKLVAVKSALANKAKTFENIIDEYNEDPGMKTGSFKETGYPVSLSSKNYDSKFVEAAMSLKNKGDISEAAKGLYGYYIIKYQDDIKAGPVDFDTIKENLRADMLKAAQDKIYSETLKKWTDEANAKVYIDRLK